ncbi:MAG: hypothetical protein A2044_02575 [Candidatus Firestonebacteria bacterium GWA2_43_8]|nr:MAG: hypothetical protein A2044_02575 [Candidatus Firestonebacteria bacterium GWA2_43_8]
MKIAIIHDYLTQYGGAERVVETLHEMFPEAPVYTSIYLPEVMPEVFKKMDIRTSHMQKYPFIKNHSKKYLLSYFKAFETFDLSEYDLILSSSSSFAKGVKKKEGAVHICYCYTPTRFIWRYADYVKREGLNRLILMVLPAMIKHLKKKDLEAVKGVDFFIAISNVVAERIRTDYNRYSVVIFPPVNIITKNKALSTKRMEDYYLIVSRLRGYKRIDLAIKAFNELGFPLKIVGDGDLKGELKKLAGPNVEFLGRLSDLEINKLYADAKAVIFPGEEDFGLVPLEAQAYGTPVIAFGAGGALDTVVEGKTGLFFCPQTEEELIKAVRAFEKKEWNKEEIIANAERFSKERFKKELEDFIKSKT